VKRWVALGAHVVGAAGLATACSSGPPLELSQVSEAVVYGADDRHELYEAPTDALRHLGERSVVALIEDQTLAAAGALGRTSPFDAPSWAERRRLCGDVRFSEQPAAATCSGALVDDDLVLTAGHCARNLDCGKLGVYFGYYYGADGQTAELDSDDVYRCAESVSFEVPSEIEHLDYGWLRLDRSVSKDKQPLRIEGAIGAVGDTTLTLLDFGGGIPLKFQTRVHVLDDRHGELDYFLTAADAFEGSSGGPLVREDGTVVGILAGGNPDYVTDKSGCLEVQVLAESAAAERATYAFQALAGLCRDSPEREKLCPREHVSRSSGGCSITPCGVGDRASLASIFFCMFAFVRRRLDGS